MFPPIFRSPRKKSFNRYAIDRVIFELQRAGVTIGFHPEGTRNKNPDPYSFLPAKPGIGEVLRRAPEAQAIPVFIIGMSNRYIIEVFRNIFVPSKYPIFVRYGKPMSFTNEDQEAITIASQIMDSIIALSIEHQKEI